MHRSWGREPFDFDGRFYRLEDADPLPKPLQQPHPPLILGGRAGPRAAALAARWADEYNTAIATVEECRERRERIAAACREIGREPIPFSVMGSFWVGLDPDALVERPARVRGGRRRARDAPAPAPRRPRRGRADRPRGDPGGAVARGYPAPRRGPGLASPLHHRRRRRSRRRRARPRRGRGAPPRLLRPPARIDAQDARGARRRGPGDAVRGRPRRGDVGAARGGADLRRRRRAHDRPGRRAARARGRGGRPRRRRGAHRPARRAARRAGPHGRRHDRHPRPTRR